MAALSASTPQPDEGGEGRRGWYLAVLLAYLALAEFCDSFATTFRYQMTTYVRADLGVEFPAMLHLLSLVYLGSCLGFVPRVAADVFGRRPTLLLVVLGLCILQWVVSLAQTPVQYAALLTLLAIFYKADIWVLVMSEEAPRLHRGLVSALPVLMGGIGAITLGEFVHRMGDAPEAWRSVARVPIWGAPLAVLFFFWTKETQPFAARAHRPRLAWRDLLASPFRSHGRALLLVTALKIVFLAGASAGLGLITSEFLRVANGFPAARVGRLVQLHTLAMMVGAAGGGWVSDRLGRVRCAQLFGVVFALSIAVMARLPAGSPWVGYAYVLGGLWDAGVIWVLRVVTMETFPTEMRGTGAAWTDLLPTIAAIGTAQSLAALTHAGVSLPTILLGIAGLVLATVPAFSLLRETRGIDLERV